MKNSFSSTLATLLPGQRAVISRIDTTDLRVQRLMVLGLVEGAPVAFVSSAIGGDPLEIQIFGSKLSLRKEQAEHFEVGPASNDG